MPRIALCAALLLSGCGAATRTVSVGGPPPGAATRTVIEQRTVATPAPAASAGDGAPAEAGPPAALPRRPVHAKHAKNEHRHGPRDHPAGAGEGGD